MYIALAELIEERVPSHVAACVVWACGLLVPSHLSQVLLSGPYCKLA